MNLAAEQAYCNTPNFPYNRRHFRDHAVISAVLQHSSRKYTESCRRMAAKSRLLDQVRVATRRWHYRIRTEDACIAWTEHYIRFRGQRHPLEMSEPEIVVFLTYLAVQGDVAASTREPGPECAAFPLQGRSRSAAELAG
jgi:Phage integrase, N-terminal SAM-like domain